MCERCPLVFRNIKHEPYTINGTPGQLFIVSEKSEFRGLKWHSLGCWGKRKFETALMIAHLPAKSYFRYV